jgi:hypothetical protein
MDIELARMAGSYSDNRTFPPIHVRFNAKLLEIPPATPIYPGQLMHLSGQSVKYRSLCAPGQVPTHIYRFSQEARWPIS